MHGERPGRGALNVDWTMAQRRPEDNALGIYWGLRGLWRDGSIREIAAATEKEQGNNGTP